MKNFLLFIAFIAGTGYALASPPATSERPVVRPATGVQPVQVQPSGTITAPERSTAGKKATERGLGLGFSLRPFLRSRKAERAAREQRKLLAKGAVCGDIDLQGEVVGRVPGRINGCGVKGAVRLRSVSGVGLSQQSVMDCTTAIALKTWVESSAKPSLARLGGGLKNLRVAAHYACRTRNNQRGAKISEHGKGRAIDISGFQLANGQVVSVLQGWNAKSTGKALQRMHREACGPFGTVLGPRADRFHRDHFHFDTARHRNGTYCK